MSYVTKEKLQAIKSRLKMHEQVREKRGALFQDFESAGRMSGEIFFGNLKQDEFEALPLKSKRKAGPARTLSPLGVTYEKAYGEEEGKKYFAVYVSVAEVAALITFY